METFKLVMPENLNHFGVLFGGYMLMWTDEVAWVAATLEYPGSRFVTIGMDRVEFRHGVREGTILRFSAVRSRLGTTSASYLVEVHRAAGEVTDEAIFSTTVTLVNVDESGHKKPLGPA
jgi:acyl-CoA hydrolase